MVFHITDIVIKITEWITDIDSVSLLQSNNDLYKLIVRYNAKNSYDINLFEKAKFQIRNIKNVNNKEEIKEISNRLWKIEFNKDFDETIDDLEISQIRNLTFGYKFNKPINKYPKSLTNLTFGEKFNQTIDNLPESLIDIKLANDFNQSVHNLPKKLKFLVIDKDQTVFENSSCVSYIHRKSVFNQPINKLPCSLSKLMIRSEMFDQEISNLQNLKSLNILYIGSQIFNKSLDILKDLHKIDLLALFCKNCYQTLYFPPNLKALLVDGKFYKNQFINLPDTVQSLYLSTDFTIMINKLPLSLEIINITPEYKKKIDHLLINTDVTIKLRKV